MTASEAAAGATIEISEILQRLPHRYPFLLVDRAEDYVPNVSLTGIKCVTVNEPFFPGHFPGNPVFPGVLVIEALAQTGALLMSKTLDVDMEKATIFFMSVDGARFRLRSGPATCSSCMSRSPVSGCPWSSSPARRWSTASWPPSASSRP